MAREDYKTKIVCSTEHPTGIEVALTEAEIDQRVADEERVTARNIERAKVQYQRDRVEKINGYASIGDQLDMMYKDQINGTTIWKDHVAKVKQDHKKPD